MFQQINFLPCLSMVILVVLLAVMLIALGRLGRIKPGGPGPEPYQPPTIGEGECVSGCSGGHTDRRYWGKTTGVVYGLPRIVKAEPGLEIETDCPIEVPSWPVRVEKP
jgi:hypothetical protein